MQAILPLASSLLSFAFAAMVLDQWWQRRRAFQLGWGIGLVWYGVAAGTGVLGPAFGRGEPPYRPWDPGRAFLVPSYPRARTPYLPRTTPVRYLLAPSVSP